MVEKEHIHTHTTHTHTKRGSQGTKAAGSAVGVWLAPKACHPSTTKGKNTASQQHHQDFPPLKKKKKKPFLQGENGKWKKKKTGNGHLLFLF